MLTRESLATEGAEGGGETSKRRKRRKRREEIAENAVNLCAVHIYHGSLASPAKLVDRCMTSENPVMKGIEKLSEFIG